MMKVVQITPGRYHHFDLARQLYKRGMLEHIFTGYPVWKLEAHGELSELPAEYIETFPWLCTPYMAINKAVGQYNLMAKPLSWLGWQVLDTLDAHVAEHLPLCDVLIAQSGCGLRCGRVAKSRMSKYICDRGSSHICYQDALMREEFAKWGLEYPGILSSWIEKEEREYELADVITVPSEFSLRSFVDMGVPRSKLRKAPYGVELQNFYQVSEPPMDRFEVLFVGGVTLLKGIPYLLEAFARLRHPYKRLIIVGSISANMQVFFARHPLAENVVLKGHTPQPELKKLMSEAHVLVLPSISDGFGMVMAQAMACGCPVIASENTGAYDLFTNGIEGFIVPIRDTDAITDCLQHLADDPKLQKTMSEMAIRRVKSIGGWGTYGTQMEAIIRELTLTN